MKYGYAYFLPKIWIPDIIYPLEALDVARTILHHCAILKNILSFKRCAKNGYSKIKWIFVFAFYFDNLLCNVRKVFCLMGLVAFWEYDNGLFCLFYFFYSTFEKSVLVKLEFIVVRDITKETKFEDYWWNIYSIYYMF